MGLRLILFIIAVFVILYIIWDHSRKTSNKNRYVGKKVNTDPLPEHNDDFDITKGIDYDIEHDIRTDGGDASSSKMGFEPSMQVFANQPASSKENQANALGSLQQPDGPVSNREFDFDAEFASATSLPGNEQAASHKHAGYNEPLRSQQSNSRLVPRVKQPDPTENEQMRDLENNLFNEPAGQQGEQTNQARAFSQAASKKEIKEIFCLYIKAKDRKRFRGEDLLQALLSVGCRFGNMNIFHRHEKASGQGDVMFSVASMHNPGSFDIEKMQDTSTPGIVLFFTFPGAHDPLAVYELMLKSSYQIAKFLDGEILDENRNPLTSDKARAIRERIESYQMKEFF